MRFDARIRIYAAVVVLTPCAVVCAAPQFPEAETAVMNDVDHWGQAFSDQHRLLEDRIADFEKQTGQGRLDYVLGVETSLRKTFPDKYRFKGRITDRVELFAARNESEAFQLAVIPRLGAQLDNVAIAVSELRTNGPDDVVIPAGAVQLWRVGFVETSDPSYPARAVGLWPDPLLELQPFSIQGRDLGLVWCEIKVPAEAAAGDYTGTITVTPANAAPMQLTVNLHVWAFELPVRVPMPMLVWTRKSSGEEFLKTAELLLAHHVDPISVGRTMDPTVLDPALSFCLERGLMFFQTPDATDFDAFRPYYDHLKEKAWLDKALLYGAHDEPIRQQFEDIVVPQTQRVRAAFPGLRTFLASEYYKGMDRGTDVILFDLSTNFQEWIEAGRPGRIEPWWYFCGIPIGAELRRCLADAPQMLLDRDAIEHRVVYWMAHHYGVRGMFTYGGDLWPKDNEAWPKQPFRLNEKMTYPYAGRFNGDGFIVYPGPRPSIRLKNIRDGAEDYWYLSALSQLAQIPRTKQAAQALQDRIMPDVFVDTHYFNHRPEALLDCRLKIGEFLERNL